MKTAFITRSTLFSVPGGDTTQVVHTTKYLRKLGLSTDILLTNQAINYTEYDLLHFINIIRPADILHHIKKFKKPFVISPNLVDYSEYDKNHRSGFSGSLFRQFSGHQNEYIKTIARWIKGGDPLKSKSYLWQGQKRSIRKVLKRAGMLLPNSQSEFNKIKETYGIVNNCILVPNGIDLSLFRPDNSVIKDDKLVICAARIEGVKNQLNLIKAINNSSYKLLVIGSPGPNHMKYYRECRKVAAKNIHFENHVSQEELTGFYKKAKVHALPSWFETCGLSSLEAAAMGCNIIVTRKGYTTDYFGEDAFYCDPSSPESIYNAVETASRAEIKTRLQQKILENYTWQKAAGITAEAYIKTISSCKN